MRDVGLELARSNGADDEVVELFALLHDAFREDEYEDERHGERAAEMVKNFQGKFFTISSPQLKQLTYACREHAKGAISDDITIGTCFDADRLDLWRVGQTPEERYFSTSAGREYLKKKRICT